MLQTIISIVPFVLCLVFIAHNLIFIPDLRSRLRLDLFLLFVALSAYAWICMVDVEAAKPDRLFALLALTLTIPSIIPLMIVYFQSFRGAGKQRLITMAWVIIPIGLFFTSLTLVELTGVDACASCVERFASGIRADEPNSGCAALMFILAYIFPTCIAIELLVALAFCILVCSNGHGLGACRGFFSGADGGADTIAMQNKNLMILAILTSGRVFLFSMVEDMQDWHFIVIDLLTTLMLAEIFMLSMFEGHNRIALAGIRGLFRFRVNQAGEPAQRPVQMPETRTYDRPLDSPAAVIPGLSAQVRFTDPDENADADAESETPRISAVNDTESDLRTRFENLLVNEQLFLQQGVTLGMIAEMLNTNKTYLSRLVNSTYNLGFPDFLNSLRVDYAEQYILRNRDARQSEIAEACGFTSASSFNIIFKKITGVTPKIWLATHS